MKKKKNSYFWASYSDLMTSLFFVMLVLFALSAVILNEKNGDLEALNEKVRKESEATKRELDNIKRIEASTNDLIGEYFDYREDYEKFILKVNCKFPRGEYTLNHLDSYTQHRLEEAGKEISKFFKKHSDNQYLLIIEGQASFDSDAMTWSNYELSFRRAAALAVFWQKTCSLDFGKKCELQIAGSGDGRFNPNTMREIENEKNQRFLIYIIPKNILNQ